MTDLGTCYICGQPMATNPDCEHCRLWSRALDANARATAEGRPMRTRRTKAEIRWEVRPRKPQRQPGPVVEIGEQELPPSDRS